MEDKKLKILPDFTNDEEAEAFIKEADLSEYDLSGFKQVEFVFQEENTPS